MSAAGEDRNGRGTLSSIDLLPEEADEDVAWALEQLRDRKLPQSVILGEFNERLLDKGMEPISKSAFNRYSVRKARQFRRLDEVQRISGALVESLATDGPDQVTIAVAEMVKTACFELLSEKEIDTKGLMELSRALQGVVGAQKSSSEHRRRLEAEIKERLAKAAAAVEEAGKANGAPAETLEKVTRLLTTGGY